MKATDPIAIDILGLLDIFIGDIDVKVALGCGPLIVVARDDSTTTQDVCCDSFEPNPEVCILFLPLGSSTFKF